VNLLFITVKLLYYKLGILEKQTLKDILKNFELEGIGKCSFKYFRAL